MQSSFLTQKLAFELSQLLPGTPVQLITASHMYGEEPRKESAIVKDISYFSITLLIVKLDNVNDEDRITGKIKEETFPVTAFEGIGCYKLERLYTEEQYLEDKKKKD